MEKSLIYAPSENALKSILTKMYVTTPFFFFLVFTFLYTGNIYSLFHKRKEVIEACQTN